MLSEKIKKYRADNDLTQEEFAAKLFVTRNAVSKWENDNGYPNIDTLKDIAKLLNITIDELLGEDDVKTIAINTNEKLNNFFFQCLSSSSFYFYFFCSFLKLCSYSFTLASISFCIFCILSFPFALSFAFVFSICCFLVAFVSCS